MTLIMNKEGKIIDDNDESIDVLKEKYNLTEQDLEPLLFGDAEPSDFDEEEIDIGDEDILKMADITVEDVELMEVGILYSEFLSILKDKFEDTEDIDGELTIIEEFLSGHGVEVSVVDDSADIYDDEEDEDSEYDEDDMDEYEDDEDDETEDDDDDDDDDETEDDDDEEDED